jgi:hypothetical protein
MEKFRSFFYENCPEEYAQCGRFGHTTWKRMEDEKILTEGLIISYSFESVMKMLHQKYKEYITYMQAEPIVSNKGSGKACGITVYFKIQEAGSDLFDRLSEDLKFYGYFIGLQEPPENNKIGLFIEPKFPFVVDMKYLKGYDFYHVTHKDYWEKIKVKGLLPMDSQTHYSHDGNRIYFMATKTPIVSKALGQTIGRSKDWNPDDVVVLKLKVLPKNIKFHIDPNFQDTDSYTALFAFTAIYPKDLEVVA